MDQYLVAAVCLVAFTLIAVGYFIGVQERNSRRRYEPTEGGNYPL